MKPRAFKRIWGKPWDFSYLLILEYHKIKEMRDYHQKRQFFEGWEYVVRDLSLCLKLIDIILERDKRGFSYDSNKMIAYVNTRNAKRFGSDWEMFNHPKKRISELLKESLRIKKALFLYNKIRAYNTLSWWD